MTTNPSTNATDASQGDDSSLQAQGATSTSQGDTSSTTSQPRSVEELERLLAEYKRDNAEYRKKAREREATLQAAEEQRLKEQGEFKQLAEKHEARVKELEPKAARFDELAEKIRKQIKTATKEWPAEVKTFYPGDDADISVLQDWYDRSQPLLERFTQQARGQAPGNRPNPPAQGQPSREDMISANMRELKKQRTYGI